MSGMPFMIVEWMKEGLRHRGYADDVIARMTPEDAHKALLTPDPVMVREFFETFAVLAKSSLGGHPPPGVLQLCRQHPHDDDLVPTRYRLDDVSLVDSMTHDALVASESGHNVFVEPRFVSFNLRGKKRGELKDTICAFALVIDSDADKARAWTPPGDVSPTLTVETSPGNHQYWFFLKEAIGPKRAQALGERMRKATGCDSDTGNPTQPYRIPGLANHPNKTKIARGRIVTPTRTFTP
jgi:RepB DNA-primase from phage plasmid